MKFKSKHQQKIFNVAVKKMSKRDKKKLATLYLLTADVRVWQSSRPYVKNGNIEIDKITLKEGSPISYTLLSCAKDIANGTSHLTIADLGDTTIVTPSLYETILEAINISRNGLGQTQEIEEESNDKD